MADRVDGYRSGLLDSRDASCHLLLCISIDQKADLPHRSESDLPDWMGDLASDVSYDLLWLDHAGRVVDPAVRP